ncbi:MAG TPA: DUF1648 domain-containing protein [Galbitalea sp.]|jgi:hypothetical protein|nr:DUF1648 domain-containing protein [Galbitalea sp.]
MTSTHHGFRLLAVAVLAPLVLTIAGVLITAELAATGPPRIATHWGFAGAPNGFGSPYTYPILIAAISIALIVLLGGTSVLAAHRAPLTRVLKLLAITPIWITVLLGVGLGGALLEQRTVASVSHAQSPGFALLVGAVGATIISAASWFVLPRAQKSPTEAETVSVAPVQLADGERASWIRTTSASRPILFVFVGIGVILGAAEILVVTASGQQVWWFLIVPVVVLLILLSNLAFTVRIDSRGVRIRSVVGFPSISIPLDNLVSANVTDVLAFTQYGGWGLRFNLNGRLGIILRSGEALEVHRRKGLTVVITIDDATTAAGLVNALVKRRGLLA